MKKIYTSVTGLIGETPLLELKNLEKELGITAKIIVKIESYNPAGSVKDRTALSMIEDAEARGVLYAGATVIEPTSGNTGIGLAAVCASRGYRLVIVMPDNMSKERCTLMRAYGAELVLTDGRAGMAGAIRRAEELAREIPDSIVMGQFDNPANPAAHYRTTGPEIFRDTGGDVDIFVCGVGTGGTISGAGRYLKEKKNAIRVVGIEPKNSAVLSGGKPGAHNLQGIGAGFVPAVLDRSVIDEVLPVTDEEAYAYARLLAKKEGILVGISSGAALAGAVALARRAENRGKTIVALLPDTGDHYLSTELFSEE